MKTAIQSEHAPQVLGPYSPAVKINQTVYLSGQLPINPENNALIIGDWTREVTQVFENLKTVAEASGGNLHSIVRVGIYLTDLTHFSIVNEVMTKYFSAPYPARTTICVAALPKGARIEADAIMVLNN